MESRNKPMGVLVGLGCVFLIFFGMLAFVLFSGEADKKRPAEIARS